MFRSTATVIFVLLLAVSTRIASAQVVREGSEFQVNTYTTDFQIYPSIATSTSGDFVVVWASYDQDLYWGGVFGQRYNSDGTPAGDEFQVNTYTADDQYFPDVASDPAGNFVVVWTSYYQDGDEQGVFARRYRADGTPRGDEFQVNTYVYGYQGFPAISAAANGDFVVVWMSEEEDGDDFGVFGQRFDSLGTPRGPEFQVNTFAEDYQGGPDVAVDANGGFVVSWTSFDEDGDGYGVFAQRFDKDGEKSGEEFQVNTYTDDDQFAASIAGDADGHFVIVWQSDFQDISDSSIFGQRFDNLGTPLGSEFRVHEESLDSRMLPAIASDPDGNFVATWTIADDGSREGVGGRSFDSSAVARSADFQVNTTTDDIQTYSAVAVDGNGDFVVVWSSFLQDGDGFGVFGQRFSIEGTAPVCTGDCNQDGLVTVDELVKGVNIALGLLPVEDCTSFDRNEDGSVTVDELVIAVNAALVGCPV
jgi:hypothetical protein